MQSLILGLLWLLLHLIHGREYAAMAKSLCGALYEVGR